MRTIFEFIDFYSLPGITSLIQVGASIGQEIAMFVEGGISHAVLIEPLPKPYEVLRLQCQAHSNYLPLNCLVGSETGKLETIYIASNFGQSSSILVPTRHTEVYPTIAFDEKLELQSFALDHVSAYVKQQFPDMPKRFDLLFIDVQGAELEVLKGASQILQEIKYVYTEMTLGVDYEGAAPYLKIIEYLECFGFKLCEFELDPNEIAHGNAIFAKRLA